MAKLREARALREQLKNRLQETFDVASTARENAPIRPLFYRRFQHVVTISESFNDQHDKVIELISALAEPDYATEDEIRRSFDDQFFQTEAIYYELFPSEAPVVGRSDALNHAASGNSARNSSQLRLPKISLPCFDGKVSDWMPYFDLFNTLIHINNSLSYIEKFQYLISSLSGEPLSLIKSLPLTADNYHIAYESLKTRYENKRLLASTYWNAIEKIPCASTDAPKELRALLTTFSENLAAFLQLNLNNWDYALFSCLLNKLDSNTRKQFELEHSSVEMPTFLSLKNFLERQCRALETSLFNSSSLPAHNIKVQKSIHSKQNRPFPSQANHAAMVASVATSASSKCALCSAPHPLAKCAVFSQKSPRERFDIVKGNRLCINCLKPSHSASSCSSTFSCRNCSARHHSLLHFGNEQSPRPNRAPTSSGSTTALVGNVEQSAEHVNVTTCSGIASTISIGQVLLATVRLEILDKFGQPCTVRALVDPGSQVSFILQQTVRKLSLPYSRSSTISVFGIGQSSSETNGNTSLRIRPIGQQESLLSLQAVVVPRICNDLPQSSIDPSNLRHIKHLALADPFWHKPAPIDMLLGADIYPSILREGTLNGSGGDPLAINTIFGWMLLGPIPRRSQAVHSFLSLHNPCLDETLKQFWEVESIPDHSTKDPTEEKVESHFCRTIYRLPVGRFGVALPFKGPRPSFNGSRGIADRRWYHLEKRLSTQPDLLHLYREFMQDYLVSNHMSLVEGPVSDDAYFIPHHCVNKLENGQSKIRVVFDASAKDMNHLSLNDTLLPGPKLQSDIVRVLLRFRLRPVVFVCDIRQMYRQILMTPEDRRYQFIRFRFSLDTPVQTYQLNTVTYGVSSAPFVAIRTLLHLASIGKTDFPLAAQALENDLYVDDLTCGCDSIEQARELRNQLIDLLATGNFELRKWASNTPSLLSDLPDSHLQSQPSSFVSSIESTIKILGLQWDSSLDSFSFSVVSSTDPCTKRLILSQIARIYDPLGFLCPLSFFLKRLIQHLWVLGVGWDDTLPDEVLTQWQRFLSTLHLLNDIRIPRLIAAGTGSSGYELHAFCDASRSGYAAVLYVRCIRDGSPITRLLISKSKVAPLKPLSIPRLELCGAVLLAKLVSFVLTSCGPDMKFRRTIAWCDSVAALTWIRSPPYKWKTFVANRVAYIQERLPPEIWRHVPGCENPADAPSRGLLPDELSSCSRWWAGPQFLSSTEPYHFAEPSINNSIFDLEESRIALLAQPHVDTMIIDNLIRSKSSLLKIQTIVAQVFRFYRNCQSPVEKRIGPILSVERRHAMLVMVRAIQQDVFASDLAKIRASSSSNRKACSPQLQRLFPFIDEEGVMRVGGRLRHANLPFDTKYPAVLPQQHILTDLVIDHYHRSFAHPGINSTLHLIRQQFWILAGRRAVTRRLKHCMNCFRTRPPTLSPTMGDLPKSRVSQLKAFSHVGVDYGGPFYVTMLRKRGARSFKAYACLFICFATKAIHIEVASDLSTDAFLAALRRFVARRGRCTKIYSDCGTNFVGAHRYLSEHMRDAVEAESIEWSFNPPAAPHFGGLWESGIKSLKTHLSRIIGNQILTFEELCTLTAQIEACLNSRPLSSLSSDPNDLSPLTPGHFLTLEPLSAPPDPDLTHIKLSRLSRWQLIQQMHRQFWQRWNSEYLHDLHQRSKWYKQKHFEPLDIGHLVLIKEDNMPPLRWKLGRIVDLHPGADNIARVATVRTTQGVFKRPLVKLCALPSQ